MPVAAEYNTKINANAGNESRFIPNDMTKTKASGANMAIVPRVVLPPVSVSISMLNKASSEEKDHANPADRASAMNIHKNTLGRKFLEVIPLSRCTIGSLLYWYTVSFCDILKLFLPNLIQLIFTCVIRT